ncbi:MAG TPA: amidohydrolase family protein [Candidatus Dojkabacteria bacterium]|nr:amidohydrolase family protein [Candidatus Dojkabacteria bacterium]
MNIIDTHLHLPVLEQRDLLKAKSILEKELKKLNVMAGIIIPDNIPNSSIGDVEEVVELCSKDNNLFVMGTVDILSKDYVDRIKLLKEYAKNGTIKAIKIFPGHDPIYPIDAKLIPVYKICVKFDIPIVIHTGWNSGHPEVAKYNDPKYIVEIAKIYSNLNIVIAHYFWPEVEYCYDLTSDIPNIYYDTSGLGDDEVITETGLEKIKDVIIKTVHKKPYSFVFGTDYAMCDIEKHINLINCLNLTSQEKANIFSKNAISLFKIKVDE